MGDAPNRLETVEAVNDQFPYLLKNNSHEACGEFVQRSLYALNGNSTPSGSYAEWRHICKNDGEAGVYLPNGQRISHDVIWHSPTQRQIDIIAAGGADPNPSTGVRPPGAPTWSEIDPTLYRPHNTPVGPFETFAVIPPSDVTITRARLGRGLFWLLRGLKDHYDNTLEQLTWLSVEEKPEVIRTFLDLEGESHGEPDCWRDGGIDGHDPQWPALVQKAIALGRQFGWTYHFTLYGGINHYPTKDDRRRFNDQIVQTINGCNGWDAVYGFHGMNEYNVNRFDESDCQDAVSDLVKKIPSNVLPTLRISLSSPSGSHVGQATNEEMDESTRLLFGDNPPHFGATTIDYHIVRDQSDRWSEHGTYNFILPELGKCDHEPFGQASSVWWTDDPPTIINAYKKCGDAGWELYVAHSAHSAWGGLIPAETVADLRNKYGDYYADCHEIRNIWDMPNQVAISNGLRDCRAGGEPPPIDGGGGGYEPVPPTKQSALYAGMSLLPDQSLHSPGGKADLRYQSDGNLVSYLEGQPMWSSQSAGETCGSLQMQPDGNLVLYSASAAIRATRTDGHPGAMVQMQDDGNFCLYADPKGPDAGKPLWASATDKFYGPDDE
jgi:hypothetical protein